MSLNHATPSAAEEEFYRAFASRDAAAMIDLWETGDGVVCVHPGAEAITGHDHIADSWRAILGDDGSFDISHRLIARFEEGGLAVHTGIESIRADGRTAMLTVTNAFGRTADGWKMVLHHAAPIHTAAAAGGAIH
jgi:ketosteroid isomerase-like protein